MKVKSTEDWRCDVRWGLSRSQTGAPAWVRAERLRAEGQRLKFNGLAS